MTKVSTFNTRIAQWRDYGAYLGNYHDTNNDFSKVNSVRFKIGAEVNESVVAGPYAIVVKNENVLVRNYERFDNPPVSYTGSASYPYNLELEDFDKNYTLVKLFNL